MAKTRRKRKPHVIVETRGTTEGEAACCFQLELVDCGNPRCKQCPDNGPTHGPYWYGYAKIEQRTVAVYIGRELDEDKGRRRIAAKAAELAARRAEGS